MKRFATVLVLLLSLPALAGADDGDVRLDVSSGTVVSHLPFDVPFALVGRAPSGTFRVALQYQEKERAAEPFTAPMTPPSSLESGVRGDGEFRLQLPALESNRWFAFHLTLDRKLASAAGPMLRSELFVLLDRELEQVVTDEPSLAQAVLVRERVVAAFQRALTGDDGTTLAPSETELVDGEGLFAETSERVYRDELLRLSEDLVARQGERDGEIRAYRETIPDLEAALQSVVRTSALTALVEALERRPELDPRNRRSELFLAEPARDLLRANDSELGALAHGRSLDEASSALADASLAEEADRFRSRFLGLERTLRELEDRLVSLAAPRGTNRRYLDSLVGDGDLASGQVQRLVALSRPGAVLHRARRWAETMEGYAHALEVALAARTRALEDIVLELESQANRVVFRQTLTTEAVSTRANVYVGLDLGVLYAPELDRATAYFGANIYLRPINKRASLRDHSDNGRVGVFTRHDRVLVISIAEICTGLVLRLDLFNSFLCFFRQCLRIQTPNQDKYG